MTWIVRKTCLLAAAILATSCRPAAQSKLGHGEILERVRASLSHRSLRDDAVLARLLESPPTLGRDSHALLAFDHDPFLPGAGSSEFARPRRSFSPMELPSQR